jgi:tetratricopeptide (TPR) repeat protein
MFIDCNGQIINKYCQAGFEQNKSNNYANAFTFFNMAIETNPDYALAYFGRVIARYGLKDVKGAFIDYSIAIKIDSNYVDAYLNRGEIKSNLSNYKGAS